MGVPDFQSLMLPLLKIAPDGKEHRTADVAEELAQKLALSEEDRNELLPSGIQTKFENRVYWARSYLGKARILESTGRGRFRITERGQEVLKEGRQFINIRSLMEFPEFSEFRKISRPGPTQHEDDKDEDKTPEESLELSYQALRGSLAQELLDRIKKCPPRFLEKLVVDLLVKMGYGGSRKDAGEAVGMSGDEGIDGIINEDKLGLDVVYIQAKRWDGPVGRPAVQTFAGSLEGRRARKGVMTTTSEFTKDAVEYV